MVRVAFLDDHPAVRAGLEAILATEPDLRLVGSVAGADAIVRKSSAAATLVEAIRAVAPNPRTISPISPQMKAAEAAGLDPADHAIVAKLEPLRSTA
jgi:DNA-binding NarL/FixJ family response regulator